MKSLPFLFLDVDGVICPLGPGTGERMVECEGPGGFAEFGESTPGRLRLLAKSYRLVWATNWERAANEFLAPALGLLPLPVIRFSAPRGRMGSTYKLAGVRNFAGPRAVGAWIDDELGDDVFAWADKRRSPFLPLGTDPRVGLTAQHVEALVSFAQRHAAAPPETRSKRTWNGA